MEKKNEKKGLMEWCKKHKGELILGGAVIGTTGIGLFVMNKKLDGITKKVTSVTKELLREAKLDGVNYVCDNLAEHGQQAALDILEAKEIVIKKL